MICPNCGNDTPNEQAFCAACGAFIRTQFGKVFSNDRSPFEPPVIDGWPAVIAEDNSLGLETAANLNDAAEIETDPLLWPSETVFIPTADLSRDIQPDEVLLPPDAAFEDAQADDFFEQSLSGRIKREDLEIEAPVAEPLVEDAVAEEPTSSGPYSIEQIEEVGFKTQAAGNVTQVIDVPVVDIPTEPDRSGPQTTKSRIGYRSIFRLSASVLFLSCLFGAGVFVGTKLQPFVVELPSIDDVPPVSTDPVRPIPPPGMVYVPGGEFRMGSDIGDPLSRPEHKITVAPFFIDVTEVTNQAYLEFVNATGHDPPKGWINGAFPESEREFPVTGITWYEAAEFAAWAGKRLPTEAEWEFAARGNDSRIYPWGDKWDPSLANAGNQSQGVRRVGQGGRSPFGAYDMAGNAWEWTASDVRAYPGGREFPWSRLRLKVIRGGNWKSSEVSSSTFFRGYYGAAGEREYLGTSFRCVKDPAK